MWPAGACRESAKRPESPGGEVARAEGSPLLRRRERRGFADSRPARGGGDKRDGWEVNGYIIGMVFEMKGGFFLKISLFDIFFFLYILLYKLIIYTYLK